MVVTRGSSPDPHLDLLDKCEWRLVMDLDPEWSLEETRLYAFGRGGWVTIFHPPWPFCDSTEYLRGWRVQQWQEDEDGSRSRRALAPISTSAVLAVVPGRFRDWVIDTAKECLAALDATVPELGSQFEVDEIATMMADIVALRGQVEDAEERRAQLRRRGQRFYGDVHFYEFPDDVDLRWDLGEAADGLEALLVQPDSGPLGTMCRALLPPDELTEWRWTDPRRWADGGEYLTPKEALLKVPDAFHGWVAAKTHEALQQARHALYDLGRRTLIDTDDLARMARLAQHAHELAGAPRVRQISYPGGGTELGEEDHVALARTSEARFVLVLRRGWRHVLEHHPEMEDHLELVVATLESPDHREPDVRPGRERFFGQGGPDGWIRVVVEMAGTVDCLVTAFPQADAPQGWRSR